MARSTFRYGAYELSWLNGEACAVKKDAHGKRESRDRLGTTKQEGKAACQAALIAFAQHREKIEIATDTTVEKVFDAYRKYLVTEGKVETPAVTVWKHLGPHFGLLSPAEISDAVCHQYALAREKAGASAGTIWTELNRLACALGWATRKDFIKERFGAKNSGRVLWQPLKPGGKEHTVTPEEVLRLVDACVNPHVRLFIMLTVMGGGARHRAVLELTWDRVDLEKGTINFRVQRQVSVLHKGHKKHRAKLPMTDTLKALLQYHKAMALTPYVVEFNGSRLLSIKKGFERAAIKAGLCEEKINRNGKKVIAATCTPHTLRHTVATWLDEEGVKSDRIAKVLGHLDPKTTEKVYTHTSEQTLKPMVDKLDVFSGLKVVGGKGK